MLCEASYPKKLAFAYLEDLQAEFHEQHGKKVPTVSRPYSFIEFGKNKPVIQLISISNLTPAPLLIRDSNICFFINNTAH